jgi:hypothetical protein
MIAHIHLHYILQKCESISIFSSRNYDGILYENGNPRNISRLENIFKTCVKLKPLDVATNVNYVYWSKVEGSEHEQPFVQINILYTFVQYPIYNFNFPLFLCQQLSRYCVSITYSFVISSQFLILQP